MMYEAELEAGNHRNLHFFEAVREILLSKCYECKFFSQRPPIKFTMKLAWNRWEQLNTNELIKFEV